MKQRTKMDWVLLNLIGVIAKKYFWFTSLLCKKNIWWAPIYWSLGSIILEPRLHYIGAPSVQQTCFLFYFWTWNTANKRFPVHYLDHHVIHKTWFYQNSPSSFLPRILKIKFRGSNILEPGSNILEPPQVPDCLCVFAYLCICLFVYLCSQPGVWERKVRRERKPNLVHSQLIFFKDFNKYILNFYVYLHICVFVY